MCAIADCACQCAWLRLAEPQCNVVGATHGFRLADVAAAAAASDAECEVWGMRVAIFTRLWIHCTTGPRSVVETWDWRDFWVFDVLQMVFVESECMYTWIYNMVNRFSLMQSMWRWTRWNIKCLCRWLSRELSELLSLNNTCRLCASTQCLEDVCNLYQNNVYII